MDFADGIPFVGDALSSIVNVGTMIDDIITGFEPQDRRAVMVYLQHSGGAIGRVAADATSFAHRKSVANMFMTVGWPLEDAPEPNVDYIRSYWDTLFPYTDGYYTVDSADESDEIRHSNYQGNFKRLLEAFGTEPATAAAAKPATSETRHNLKHAPSPGVESTSITPLCCSVTMK